MNDGNEYIPCIQCLPQIQRNSKNIKRGIKFGIEHRGKTESKRSLKGTKAIIRKVQLGQEGKSEEELKQFALSEGEQKSVSRHKGMEVLCSIAMLAVIAVAIWLWTALDGNFLVIVIGVILAIACYVQVDSHHVEQHRIELGYYKKEYGFYCKKCRNKVTIPFHRLEKYTDLPTNEAGIRIMACSQCGNTVPMIGFDRALKDYKKYVQKR